MEKLLRREDCAAGCVGALVEGRDECPVQPSLAGDLSLETIRQVLLLHVQQPDRRGHEDVEDEPDQGDRNDIRPYPVRPLPHRCLPVVAVAVDGEGSQHPDAERRGAEHHVEEDHCGGSFPFEPFMASTTTAEMVPETSEPSMRAMAVRSIACW